MSTIDRVKQFLANCPFYSGPAPTEVANDFQLVESGVLDSLAIFNLIVFLEKEFRIEIQVDELSIDNFSSFASIERFIAGKTGGSAAQEL